MTDRREILHGIASVAVTAGLAGCSQSTPTRGDTLDSTDTFGFKEIDGGDVYSIGLSASQYCELEYSGELRKPDEGFEAAGQVDVLVVDESVYREVLLGPPESTFIGFDESFLSNPPAEKLEDASALDIDGEFEQLQPGLEQTRAVPFDVATEESYALKVDPAGMFSGAETHYVALGNVPSPS